MIINARTPKLIKAFAVGSLFSVSIIMASSSFALAQDEVEYDMRQKDDTVSVAINAVLQEIFWRVRANDYSAFYDFEYPHIRQTVSIDQYLHGASFRENRKPNSDDWIGIALDSVGLTEEKAMAFVTLSINDPAADTVTTKDSRQVLYFVEGRWIRPLTSSPASSADYNQLIENYEEAVRRDEEDGN